MPSSFFFVPLTTARTASARATALLGSRLGLVQATLAGVLWGTTGVVVQLVRDDTGLSAVSISFYRLAIASVALLLLSTARLAPLLAALRSGPGPLVLVGWGLRRTSRCTSWLSRPPGWALPPW